MVKGDSIYKRAVEIHQNAVEHGWWEGKRDIDQIFALIHCELSEAIEEERAGRGMLWFGEGGKPEGIAVELVDAAIRMLDYIAYANEYTEEAMNRLYCMRMNAYKPYKNEQKETCSLSHIVNAIHSNLSFAWLNDEEPTIEFLDCIASINSYLADNNIDFDDIMEIKHNYNVKRPYKHGKQY